MNEFLAAILKTKTAALAALVILSSLAGWAHGDVTAYQALVPIAGAVGGVFLRHAVAKVTDAIGLPKVESLSGPELQAFAQLLTGPQLRGAAQLVVEAINARVPGHEQAVDLIEKEFFRWIATRPATPVATGETEAAGKPIPCAEEQGPKQEPPKP